ncbi:MAG: hypothetical protein WDW38_009444 [Sanguina aurantia]
MENANVNPTSADRRSRIKVGPLTPEYIQSIYGFKMQGHKDVELEVFGLLPTGGEAPAHARQRAPQSTTRSSTPESSTDASSSDTQQNLDNLLLSEVSKSEASVLVSVLLQLAKLDSSRNEAQANGSSGGSRTSSTATASPTSARRQEPVLVELLPLLQQKLTTLSGAQLVSVAVALAKIQHSGSKTVDSNVFVALLAASEAHLSTLPAHALANLVWALGHAVMEEQVDNMDVQDIANTMWGLCTFDLMPDVWLVDIMVERALLQIKAEGSSSSSASQIVCSRSGQPTQPGQDAATIITCVARYYFRYNYHVPEEWLPAFLSAILPQLRSYLPADLVSIIHSVVTLNCEPSRAWMAAFYGVIRERLVSDPTLPTSAFSRLLWALARVDYTPPQSWLRQFAALSRPRLRALRYRGQVEMIWAMACWDCPLDRPWLFEFLRVSSARMDEEYKPQQLAITLSALAKLNCKVPNAWLAQALQCFMRQLPDAKSHDLVTFLECIPRVCDDRAWLASQRGSLRQLGDAAKFKFELYDAVMHARLVLALAAVKCCPTSAWLAAQQVSLAKVWSDGSLESGTEAELHRAYVAWDMEIRQSETGDLEATA